MTPGMPVPPSQSVGGRLDSWKEIAEYLRRDLRTVRRWEKTRDLPIRRVPGGGRSAVYAFRREIDTWLLDTSSILDVSPQNDNSGDLPRQLTEDFGGTEATVSRTTQTTVEPTRYRPRAQRFAPLLKFAAVVSIVVAIAISTFRVLRHKELSPSFTTSPEAPPRIVSVSAILPQQDQTIRIKGAGLGLHTSYKSVDTPFIAVRDKTARWAAGRIIPQNWDEVTLNVESWQDNEIVISGFAGAYGTGQWKLNLGDKSEIAVWNPQSGHGPAVYHLIVSASPLQK
jgi:hypothetical protein